MNAVMTATIPRLRCCIHQYRINGDKYRLRDDDDDDDRYDYVSMFEGHAHFAYSV